MNSDPPDVMAADPVFETLYLEHSRPCFGVMLMFVFVGHPVPEWCGGELSI
jgi:hypothetical protein